jgi:hypothetical protein
MNELWLDGDEWATFSGDGVRRWRQPDVRDSCGGDVIDLPHHHVVPPAALLPRLPVEPLQQDAINRSPFSWLIKIMSSDSLRHGIKTHRSSRNAYLKQNLVITGCQPGKKQ